MLLRIQICLHTFIRTEYRYKEKGSTEDIMMIPGRL